MCGTIKAVCCEISIGIVGIESFVRRSFLFHFFLENIDAKILNNVCGIAQSGSRSVERIAAKCIKTDEFRSSEQLRYIVKK